MTRLGYVNDPSIPSHVLLLIESFKVVITELKVIHAISINTIDYLTIENARLNDELIKH